MKRNYATAVLKSEKVSLCKQREIKISNRKKKQLKYFMCQIR